MIKAIDIDDFISLSVEHLDVHVVRIDIPPSYTIPADIEKEIDNFLNEIHEELDIQLPFNNNDIIITFDSEKELYMFLKIYEKYKDCINITVFLKEK